MIGYLEGRLLEKSANVAVVVAGGVGYEVSIPLSTFYELGDAGDDVQLRIYTHVREDAMQLFGFRTVQERDLFLRLISVQGVGPRLAITILSGMSADEVVSAIRSNNVLRLKSVPGVGQKTAERVIIDLRDKIAELSAGGAHGAETSETSGLPSNEIFDDAHSALVNLGYQRAAAEKALKQAAEEGTGLSVQKLLRRSLQILAK